MDLVCPTSRLPLHRMSIIEANEKLEAAERFAAPRIAGTRAVGITPEVLVRDDYGAAYPILDNIPILLSPEVLRRGIHEVSVCDGLFAEAYAEMRHYSTEAEAEVATIRESRAMENLRPLLTLRDVGHTPDFPDPPELWLDMMYEMSGQSEAFRHLGAVNEQRILTIGGRGLQAVKLLLAGAEEVWLVTPMLGELIFARELARLAGVEQGFQCAVAGAEQLPFPDRSFDAVFSQGSVHHWVTDVAIPECARVISSGGRFAAVEPWRAPLYSVGTRIFGKRDPAVHCVVLDGPRIEPQLHAAFEHVRIRHHGALVRYPLLLLWKFKVTFRRRTLWRLFVVDDRITRRFPRLRRTGSCVALLASTPRS